LHFHKDILRNYARVDHHPHAGAHTVILVEPFKTAPMNSAIRLYEHELSGNAYKVRLFLLLLGLPFAAQRVDLFAGEGQKP
jgi:hypothetical protein